MERRAWVYRQRPDVYGIAGCNYCAGNDTDWSEFVGRIWCRRCKREYVPAHNGVFDGPIPIEVARLMGMSFDKVQLSSGA